MVSLCVMFLICFHFINIFKEELKNVYEGSLQQIQSTFDGEFLSVMTISNNLAIDNRTKSLAYSSLSTDDFKADKYIAMSKIQENFKIYLATNQYIDDIFLLFPDKKYVLSSKTHYTVTELFEILNNKYGVNIKNYDYLFNKKYNNELKYFINKESGNDLYFILQSIQPFKKGQSALIMIQLNEDELKKFMLSEEENTIENALFLPDDFKYSYDKLTFINEDDYYKLMENHEFSYILYEYYADLIITIISFFKTI